MERVANIVWFIFGLKESGQIDEFERCWGVSSSEFWTSNASVKAQTWRGEKNFLDYFSSFAECGSVLDVAFNVYATIVVVATDVISTDVYATIVAVATMLLPLIMLLLRLLLLMMLLLRLLQMMLQPFLLLLFRLLPLMLLLLRLLQLMLLYWC